MTLIKPPRCHRCGWIDCQCHRPAAAERCTATRWGSRCALESGHLDRQRASGQPDLHDAGWSFRDEDADSSGS